MIYNKIDKVETGVIRLSTDYVHHIVKIINKTKQGKTFSKCDMIHLTRDRKHMTCDALHVPHNFVHHALLIYSGNMS